MAKSNKTSYDVICVGNVMIDLLFCDLPHVPAIGEELVTTHTSIDVGGGAANTAIALSKLGRSAALAGVVGSDIFGDYIKRSLVNHGVGIRCLHDAHEVSTTISVEMSFPEDRATVTSNTTSHCHLDTDTIKDMIRKARHLHLVNLDEENVDLLKCANEFNVTTSVDTNLKDEMQAAFFAKSSALIDLLMPNCNEVPRNNSTIEAVSRELGGIVRGYCVIKAGPEGAFVSNGSRSLAADAFNVNVVDTTGAGDAFNAGFLFGFLDSRPIEDCVIIGNSLGALSIGEMGATRGLPDLVVLQEFLFDRGFDIL